SRFVKYRAGGISAVFGWASAVTLGAMTEGTGSSLSALAFGTGVSFAYNAGTVTKATTIVAINRAANLIVAPLIVTTSCEAGQRTPLRSYQTGLCFLLKYLFYGAGTLITVFTMVTDATSDNALPFSVVIAAFPAVENVTPAEAMMVPTMVPPPAPLIVAALPTCQKTFLACAPLIRMTLRGAPAAPTVSVEAIWKTNMAFALPWASRVRSDPVIRSEPPVGFQTPGARVSPPKFAPGSPVDGIKARALYAVCALAKASCAVANVAAVPSLGHVRVVGGGAAVYIVPLTVPTLSVVSVYIHPAETTLNVGTVN